MAWTLRRAVPTDRATIEALFIEMLQSVYHREAVAGYAEGALDKFFSGREDWICVAEMQGSVVAYVAIEAYRTPLEYVYLDDLAVTKAYRNHGIGSALIGKAEAYARERRISTVVLHVEKANAAALRLYERLGYRRYRDDESRYLMRKDIPLLD